MNENSTDITPTSLKETPNNMGTREFNEPLIDNDKGIIQVSEYTKEQHPILAKLSQIEQVQPLLKDNHRSLFNFEGLLDIGTSGIKALSGTDSSTPQSSSISFKSNSENSSMINVQSSSLADILIILQRYTSKQMSKVNEDQKRLLNRIKYIDGLSLKSSQIITTTLNQSKLVCERLNEAKQVKEHAKKTRQYATSIFESLQKLEQTLDPEDRVGHPEFVKKWPALNSLYERVSNQQYPQPIILTRTNSGLNQKSTIATTKTTMNTVVSFDDPTTIATTTMTNTITSSSSSLSSTSSLPLSSSSNSLHSNAINNNIQQQQQSKSAVESLSSSSSIVMDRLRSLVGAKKN
ncbi:unnamed protein product [Cunninghamella blakesleeana]